MNTFKHDINSEGVESSDENFDFKGFLYKVLRDWWIILLSIIICLSISYSYLRYTTPIYKIRANILVADEKKGAGGIGGGANLFGEDISSLLGGKSSVENEVEILKTRNLMEKVVRGMDLNVVYYSNGRIKQVEVLDAPFKVDILSPIDSIKGTTFQIKPIDKLHVEIEYTHQLTKKEIIKTIAFGKPFTIDEIGRIQISKKPQVAWGKSNYNFTIKPFDATVSEFQKNLTVNIPNKQVTTVYLEINHAIPKKGEDILNRFIKEYIQQSMNDKNEIADSTIQFIENRLHYVSQELGSVEGNIQNFKQSNKIADITEQSKLLVTSTSDYVGKLANIQTQISIVDALVNYLKDDNKNKRVVPGSILPQDEVFGSLVQRYNGFLLEQDRLLLSSTDENPYVKNLNSRIADLRADMLSNLSNTRRSLVISKNAVLKSNNMVEGLIRNVPAQERTYLDLARQQRIKQELYIYLLKKREETAISKTSNISGSRVIDRPKSEDIPFNPKRSIIYIIALLLGLLLPLIKIYLKELFNVKILNKQDIEKRSNVPIIGELSHNDSNEILIVHADARSPISEQFRALRTNLQFFSPRKKEILIQKSNCMTILMTSSMSGEGKSFTAVNLGAVLAISGKKVLLMELDLRKPKLSQNLNMTGSFGFTNYIIDEKLKPKDIILPTAINSKLFVISSGPIPPNPAEAILNERMETLMFYLKAEYDYIIIDAPPIGLVADAQLVSAYTDLVLYLVRQNHTHKEQLRIPNELYLNKKFNKMALIVNDIPFNSSYSYGYGYTYGYGYGSETQKSQSFLNKIFNK